MAKRWTWKKCTLAEVKEAVANSDSYAQVLSKLGLKIAGGNYDSLKKLLKHII